MLSQNQNKFEIFWVLVNLPDLHLLNYVGPVGLEPTTHGLKVRCSTD